MPTVSGIRLLAGTVMVLIGLHPRPLTGQVAHSVVGADPAARVDSAGEVNLAVGSRDSVPGAAEATGGGSTEDSRQGKLKLPDFNRDIYYKNKLEVSLESGWLPINVPFVWDFLVGSPYTIWPLAYTMQPNLLSLRWQLGDAKGL